MLFEQVYDSWQKARDNYKLWHRQDFISALIKDATGQTMVGAAGDHVLAQHYNTTSTTSPQVNQGIGPGFGLGPASPPAVVTCRALNSVDQSIPTNSGTVLSFDSEQFDTGGFHDNIINNSRLTISQTGFYEISSSITWAANGAGVRSLELQTNGIASNVLASQFGVADAARNTTINVNTIALLNAGDYVEALVLQTSGGNLNVLHTAGFLPYLAIVKLR